MIEVAIIKGKFLRLDEHTFTMQIRIATQDDMFDNQEGKSRFSSFLASPVLCSCVRASVKDECPGGRHFVPFYPFAKGSPK